MQKSSYMIAFPENSLLLNHIGWNEIIKRKKEHSFGIVLRADLPKSHKIFERQLQTYLASKRKLLSNRNQEKNENTKKPGPSKERKK